MARPSAEQTVVQPDDQGYHRDPAMLSSPNAEFEDMIKDGILDLCDKYLDSALPVSKQRGNAEKVFSQVVQNPWFFQQDTKHRRSLARKAIRDYQYSRYRKVGRETHKLERFEEDDSDYMPSSEDEEGVENEGDDDEYEDHLDDTPVSDLVRHSPLGKVVNKPSPRKNTTEPIAPVDFVKGFLSSCKPSMMQYESHFRNFKADKETLRGAAGAHWSKDERASLVRRILKSSGSSELGVNEMHVCMLEHHLRNYDF